MKFKKMTQNKLKAVLLYGKNNFDFNPNEIIGQMRYPEARQQVWESGSLVGKPH